MRIRATRQSHGTDLVPVARNLLFQSPVKVEIWDINGYDIELTVKAEPMEGNRAGRLYCTNLCVKQKEGGAEVTSEGIRGIPVAAATRQAAEHILLRHKGRDFLAYPDLHLSAALLERMRQEGPVKETLERVAFIYELATVMRQPPVQAVAKEFSMPRSTAGRWVTLARERGYLAPVTDDED